MDKETFTNGQLFTLREPLRALAKIDVPAKVGIRVARLIRKLRAEIEPIGEVRNQLIGKYGEKNEKGEPFINAESPDWKKFVEEHDALMAQTVEVEFEKVVLPDEVVVAVDVLVALEPFLAVADIPGVTPNGVATHAEELVKTGK